MKKTIYVLPHSPSSEEMRIALDTLHPPISNVLKDRLLDSLSSIQTRLLSVPVNQVNFHFNQSQTFTDANHTITFKGRLKEPSFIKKLLGLA